MLTWIDWIVVCAPVVLGVLGALLSIRPPGKKIQWPLIVVLVVLGMATTAATLYQIRQTRISEESTHRQDDTDKKALQTTIDDLNAKIKVLSETSIPTLLGDVKGLKRPKGPPPDLRVRLVSPEEVAIVIDNSPHAGLADRPKYGVMLVD